MPSPAPWFGFESHGIIAKPGASVFLVPWIANKTATGITTRLQASTLLGGGYIYNPGGAQNDEITWDIWLDDGTYKVAGIIVKNTDAPIHSLQLDAVEKATMDAYNGSATLNNYIEVTGIAVTKGLKVFKDKYATKNASSTNYIGAIQSLAWIRTGA